jgi:thiamine pyrophosphate-dependent acetolactate synthase large subunit-like protein
MAKGMSIQAIRVKDPAELEDAVEDILAHPARHSSMWSPIPRSC